MKMNYNVLSVLCLLASVPLVIHLAGRRSAGTVPVVRFGSFNVAMNRAERGALLAELRGGGALHGRQIAEIVQRAQVDILLLCELDRDLAAETARIMVRDYFGVSQNGQTAIDFTFLWCGPVNTGEPSGLDLDRDGDTAGPGDAFGYGAFPGQYGMALLSRHPILEAQVRSFQKLAWSAMPSALRPMDYYDDATWAKLRLSSKSHWDVPIRVGARVVHALCSHPTPPVFDGKEDRNGCRNHDEIRFWVDYLTPGQAGWMIDDAGTVGGLGVGEHFVVMGDLNGDPADGDGRPAALQSLLAHARVQDPLPRSAGGAQQGIAQLGANATQAGAAALDTGDFPDEPGKGPGNLRVDYVLPSRELTVVKSGVCWPLLHEAGAQLVLSSDHRLVWVDIEAR